VTRDEAETQLRRASRVQADASRPSGPHEVTEAVTHAAEQWLRWMGASEVKRDASVAYSYEGRLISGRVRLAARWPDGTRMGVEVDGSHKPRIMAVLESLRGAGWRVVWIRWDTSPCFEDVSVPYVWVRAAIAAHMPSDAKSRPRQLPLLGNPRQ
jgi:hypothetical protein